MNKVRYVICGFREEYDRYCGNMMRSKHLSEWLDVKFVHVATIDNIMSDANPDGVFIGQWWKHPQISGVLSRFYMVCTDPKKRQIINNLIDRYVNMAYP